MTKCPYVPPHPWNIDFPHLMLRAKHVQHRKGEHSFPRQTTVEHARARQHRRHSRGRRDRQRGERHEGSAASCWRPRSAWTRRRRSRSFIRTPAAKRARRAAGKATQVTATDETRGKVALFVTCYGDRNEPHMPEDLTVGVRAQRHSGEGGGQGKVLRHAQARARRSRDGGEVQELQHSAAEGAHRRRLRHRRAHSLLRAHVQAGAAADVPRGRGRAGGQGTHLRSVRIPDAAPQGGTAAHRFHAEARQGQLPRALPSARAEHRAQDARRAQARAGDHGRRHRALLGSQRHLRGEEGIPRGFGEDRQAGGFDESRRRRPITTRATARWRATRSTAGFRPMRRARGRASPNIP